ncbi:hypothetical protein QQS21_007491 [Conoideocrella luteorostrata]|uniref:Major facilitator superfamily (MFS) profile domain-containing protein n=1 Tax=Conoideocrella luteorostrata TaxID=1105319 RepID=A0AAJ0CKN0_9HYPO|nr:hypothetical protein QQS21_007491 [Conoideocrella luteorostrata]
MESSTPSRPAIELQPVTSSNTGADNEASSRQINEQNPTGLRFILLTIGLILSIFLAALDSSILATAVPRITDKFGTVKDVGWYSSAYVITNAAFQSSWGRGYKFFPLMWTFIAAVTTFELGNTISALAQNSATLILGRFVAGIGCGGVMTGCFIIIALSVKPQQRAS